MRRLCLSALLVSAYTAALPLLAVQFVRVWRTPRPTEFPTGLLAWITHEVDAVEEWR